MLDVIIGKKYRKDIKRLRKRGKNLSKLDTIVHILARQDTIPIQYRPHRLSGDMIPYWDLHIEPDWLLIYRIYDDVVELYRTGTHSDIF